MKGRRKTSRRKTSQRKRGQKGGKTRKTSKLSPSQQSKIVLGKIYANGCGHCQNMANDWEIMKTQLPASKFDIWEIEAAEEEAKKKEFQQKNGVDLQSSGYPTIFMVVQGKQIDYNGERDSDSLVRWAKLIR